MMATYNGAKFLSQQLDSIFNQTLPPDEVVIVDDCSKDDTVNIIKDYSTKYNIVFCQNEHNLGVNKTFERAISMASGDYICISDQDDVWFPNKIQKSYETIVAHEYGGPICVSSYYKDVDENMNVCNYERKISDSEWEHVMYGYASQGCSLMFNKQLKEHILPLSETFIYDHYIGLLSCFVGKRYVIGETLMYYRHHGNNVVSGKMYNYHQGFSPAMEIYEIMKSKERFLLLDYLKTEKYGEMHDEGKSLLEKMLHFFDVKSDFSILLKVLKNSYFSLKRKFYLFLYIILLPFLKKRKVKEMVSNE